MSDKQGHVPDPIHDTQYLTLRSTFLCADRSVSVFCFGTSSATGRDDVVG
jgi:hypothetical protein